VRLNGEKLGDPDQIFEAPAALDGQVMQLGKKKFVRFGL
jgi:tyrosyl-tRNA synthetase